MHKLGTDWETHDGMVRVLAMAEDTDLLEWAKDCDYDADEATPDDFPLGVPDGLVVIFVPVVDFDFFVDVDIATLLGEDPGVMLFAMAEDAWSIQEGGASYSDLPIGQALAALL